MLRFVKLVRARAKIVTGTLLLGSLAGFAVAQSVDGLDIQRVLGRASNAQSDAQALADEIVKRGDAMRDEARATAEGGQRNLQANGARLTGGSIGPIDFDEIIKTATATSEDRGRAPQLIVFASLSMPEDSLKALIRDTALAGGTVTFNGFPGNSMKAFQQGIMKVVDNNDAYSNIGVDPRLFRAFKVRSVPTVVVATSDFDLCDGFDCTTQVPPFDRISGNVTLGYALETFANGDGPGAAIAGQALARLQKGAGS